MNEHARYWQSRAKSAEGAIDRIRMMHRASPNSVSAMHPIPACKECGENFPCSTIKALDPDDA